MRETYKFSPSLMCMDFMKLQEQLLFFNRVANALHLDIMDGHFVRNLTLSPSFIQQIAPFVEIPMDAHLMVDRPQQFLDAVLEAGADLFSPHIEVTNSEIFRLADILRGRNKKIGVTISPATPVDSLAYCLDVVDKVTVMTVDPGFAGQPFIPQMLKKIEVLRNRKESQGLHFELEVDGSCNRKTFADLASAGTEVFVVGTSGLFSRGSTIEQAWKAMMDDFYSVVAFK